MRYTVQLTPAKDLKPGHITYGTHEPTAFMLSDDLLEAFFGDKIYVRVGDKKHRILRLNTLVAADEVEIECEDD